MFMTKAELKEKFPNRTILSEPVIWCEICKGKGWYKTKSKTTPENPCLCASTTGSAELRAFAAKSLRDTIKNLRKELGL